jgi:tyrosinase
MDISRRRFLTVAASSSILAYAGRSLLAQPSSSTRVRFDAYSPEGKAMLRLYAAAVKKMKTLPEGHPHNWNFQWYTHWVRGTEINNATKVAEIQRIYTSPSAWKTLAEEMWNTCQGHGPGMDPDLFLPWHRAYLHCFEDIVRNLSGEESFTLPYWNYSTTDESRRGKIPPEFRQEGHADFGSLYVKDRNPGVNAGRPIHKDQNGNDLPGDRLNTGALSQCTYQRQGALPGFCRALDGGLHGHVHVLLGTRTNMGFVPTAANDPIFWLHHSNIDRLWASWNAAGRKNPQIRRDFVFANRSAERVVLNAGAFLEMSKLDYRYDQLESVPKCPEDEGGMVARRMKMNVVANVPAVAAQLTSEPVTVKLRPAPPPGGNGMALAPFVAGLPPQQRLLLIVDGLKTNQQPGVLYDIFLELPDNADQAKRNAHYVGSINFFDAQEHDHGHAGGEVAHDDGRFLSFDVTKLMKELANKDALAAEPTLTIAPAGTPAGDARPVVGALRLVQQ